MGNEESPLDGPRDEGPTPRERTPEASDSTESEPNSAAEGDTPSSPAESEGEGKNTTGRLPDPQAGKLVPAVFDDDPWGVLPERFRHRFRNQGGGGFPVRYRNWIDAYYERLNQVTR